MCDYDNKCPILEACQFFSTLDLPSTGEILKSTYCYDDYRKCARFQMNKQKTPIPDSLWPDGKTDLKKKTTK